MRFLHISDIHLGKLLFQQNLLEIQIDLLNQIINYLVDNGMNKKNIISLDCRKAEWSDRALYPAKRIIL